MDSIPFFTKSPNEFAFTEPKVRVDDRIYGPLNYVHRERGSGLSERFLSLETVFDYREAQQERIHGCSLNVTPPTGIPVSSPYLAYVPKPSDWLPVANPKVYAVDHVPTAAEYERGTKGALDLLGVSDTLDIDKKKLDGTKLAHHCGHTCGDHVFYVAPQRSVTSVSSDMTVEFSDAFYVGRDGYSVTTTYVTEGDTRTVDYPPESFPAPGPVDFDMFSIGSLTLGGGKNVITWSYPEKVYYEKSSGSVYVRRRHAYSYDYTYRDDPDDIRGPSVVKGTCTGRVELGSNSRLSLDEIASMFVREGNWWGVYRIDRTVSTRRRTSRAWMHYCLDRGNMETFYVVKQHSGMTAGASGSDFWLTLRLSGSDIMDMVNEYKRPVSVTYSEDYGDETITAKFTDCWNVDVALKTVIIGYRPRQRIATRDAT